MGLFNLFGGDEVFAKAVAEAEKDDGIMVVDVRTPAEYAGGHIKGSINVPVETIDTYEFPEDKRLYVYCMSGARSERACRWLKENGVDAENIGGIAGFKGETEK